MAGRGSAANPSPARVKSLLLEQIRDAARALDSRGAPSDESVHRARKTLKRARASLRLLRGAVGHSTYRRENACLRDAARSLSRVRDARVMMETLDDLVKRSRRTSLAPLRSALRQERQRARREVLGRPRRTQLAGTPAGFANVSKTRSGEHRSPDLSQPVDRWSWTWR
jgi:CHAD domain-containing protein